MDIETLCALTLQYLDRRHLFIHETKAQSAESVGQMRTGKRGAEGNENRKNA